MARAPARGPKSSKVQAANPPASELAPAPEQPVAFDAEGLKRVQDIIRNARATWFALLGALVFAAITLASVKDVSFFVSTVETKLPLVGLSVPVTSFFWAGSLLIAALYAYFHLYLELLWQALGDFPPRDKDGVLLADRIEPWIVAETALRFRDRLRSADGDRCCSRERAMPFISNIVSLGLVWIFGLVVIGWFWWRYMPKHDPVVTLFLGLVLCVTYFVFMTSLVSAWSHLKFENTVTRATPNWQWSVPLVLLAIIGATLVRTGRPPSLEAYDSESNPLIFGETLCAWSRNKVEGPAPANAEADTKADNLIHFLCKRRSDLYDIVLVPTPADLSEVVFTEKPKDWQGKEIAEAEFRIRWCKERGERCPNPMAIENRDLGGTEEIAFQSAWNERWDAMLRAFVKPDLRGVDWRAASLKSASLEGVDLSGALLEGADFENADLDGAVLQNSKLTGATFVGASVKRARFNFATLDEVSFDSAMAEGADFENAQLNNALLTGAKFAGANFIGASLRGGELILFKSRRRKHWHRRPSPCRSFSQRPCWSKFCSRQSPVRGL